MSENDDDEDDDDQSPYPTHLNQDIKIVKNEDDVVHPFMCPHCAKVYVREVTFKRHVAKCTAANRNQNDGDMYLNWDELQDDDYDCDDLFGSVSVRENGVDKARTRVVVTQDNCIDHAVEEGEETMAQKFMRHLLRDIRKSTRRSRCDF